MGFPTLFFIGWQTLETKRAARAALRNSEAFINVERAWIMVQLDPVPGQGGPFGGEEIIRDIITHKTGMIIRLICKNEGGTPAWITEKRACVDVVGSLPVTPNWDAVPVIQSEPEPLSVGEASAPKDEALVCNKARDSEKMIVVYGLVKYRDVFSPGRTTSFAYKIRVDGKFERLSGYPEYNMNT